MFQNTYLSKEHRYWLGVETESGVHFAAIPVSNKIVDYVEAYKISDEEYQIFMSDESLAIDFIEGCRRRQNDDRLFIQPGTDRGHPI